MEFIRSPCESGRPDPGRRGDRGSRLQLGDDLGEKLEEYAAGGLSEYWVADVQGRLVLRHAGPQAGGYAKREPARFGEIIAALTHAALRIDTGALK